jgi:hypothetical protein
MMSIKKTFLQSLLLSDPEVSAKRNGGGWNVMTIAHMVRLCQLKKKNPLKAKLSVKTITLQNIPLLRRDWSVHVFL